MWLRHDTMDLQGQIEELDSEVTAFVQVFKAEMKPAPLRSRHHGFAGTN